MLPLTFAALALLTGALILLRIRWRCLSQKTHKALIVCASAAILLYLFTLATGWNTAFYHLNAALYWLAVAGYEFFVLLFTLLRPRWLTAAIAAVLLLPLLSASPFLPLADLFNLAPHAVASIGGNFVTDRTPWGSGGAGSSGFDLVVFSHPSWTHLIRRRRQASRYYNGQCDAAHAFATIQPDGKHVLMSCPAAPGQQSNTARNLVVKLY